MMSRAGSNRTFKEAKEDLNIYAGITVSAKRWERVAEATGKEVEAWQKYINLQILKKQQKPRQLPLLSLCCISPMTARVKLMVPWETEGRKGKQPDGSAKTREVKIRMYIYSDHYR